MLNQKRSGARCGEDCCHESEEDSHRDDKQVRQLELQRSNHGSRKRGCLIFFFFPEFLVWVFRGNRCGRVPARMETSCACVLFHFGFVELELQCVE